MIFLIVGRTGTGKTYLANELVHHEAQTHAIIFDPYYQFSTVYRCPENRCIISNNPGADAADAFLQQFKLTNCTIVFDELAEYISNHPRGITPLQSTLIRSHRIRRINIIATTQRIADIHHLFIQNCDHIFVFAQRSHRDIAVLANYCMPDDIERIRALDDTSHEYVII